MRYLSLFSGIGGGDLACQHLMGWECLGYVEWEKYCGKTIEQRIKDRIFSDAPVFNCDIREFNRRGYADQYKGLVDVITGGPPCQAFSGAGKQAGEADERNMWPAAVDTIRRVRPGWVLLENVAAITGFPYFRTIVGELSSCGYDCAWRTVSAFDVGARHLRKRLWIVGKRTDNLTGVIRAYRMPELELSLRQDQPYMDWSTPTTMDSLSPKSEQALRREAQEIRPGRARPNNLRDQISNAGLWPTPKASNANGAGVHGDGGLDLQTTVKMFPTPAARDYRGANSVDTMNAKLARGGRCHADQLPNHIALNYPTPSASMATEQDMAQARYAGNSGARPAYARARLWPTPTTQEIVHEDLELTDTGRRKAKTEGGGSHALNLADAVLWPTPGATPRGACTGEEAGSVSDDGKSRISAKGVRYGASLQTAVHHKDKNKVDCDKLVTSEIHSAEAQVSGALNPEWVSWLMGYPTTQTSLEPVDSAMFDFWLQSTVDGTYWAVDPADIGVIPRTSVKTPNRTSQLKAIGNGQVPLCVYAAWTILSETLNRKVGS